MPRESRWHEESIFRMTACTTWPFFRTSEGCLTRLVHDRSETCTRPSMPSSISMKAPKSVMFRTRPSTIDAIARVDGGPRVGFELLQAQRDAPVLGVHLQHHRLHLIAGLDQIGRASCRE